HLGLAGPGCVYSGRDPNPTPTAARIRRELRAVDDGLIFRISSALYRYASDGSARISAGSAGISDGSRERSDGWALGEAGGQGRAQIDERRSEEHTSELQ